MSRRCVCPIRAVVDVPVLRRLFIFMGGVHGCTLSAVTDVPVPQTLCIFVVGVHGRILTRS